MEINKIKKIIKNSNLRKTIKKKKSNWKSWLHKAQVGQVL